MKRITLVPVGGLANRLKAIASGISLAQDCQSELQIIWLRDKGLNCRFDQLLQLTNFPNVSIREGNWIDTFTIDKPRKSNFYLPSLYQKWSFDNCLREAEVTRHMMQHFDFKQWADKPHVYMAACVLFYPTLCPIGQFFCCKDQISQQIEKITSSWENKPVIGVHIRRTDNLRSIQESPTELFIQTMKRELQSRPDTLFYLATDSEEEKTTLKEIFQDHLVFQNQPTCRNSVSGIQNALIELYVLSKCDAIIGSYGSSYSETAAQLGQKPYTQIRK